MGDKKALEAFRVLQFASPHPVLAAAAAAAASSADQQSAALAASAAAGATGGPAAAAAGPRLVPDHDRIIVHFDVDCFYAQVEECRNPALRGQPLAVTQKYLVVTANYPARAAGVTKLMGIADAKKACPHLVLVPGEDLTPYRAASRDIRAVLSRWGPLQKLGLDECWVDITQEVQRRVATSNSSGSSIPWCGHLVDSGLQLTAASKHRPMDLRVVQEGHQQQQQEQQEQKQQEQQQQGHQEQEPHVSAAAAAAGGHASTSMIELGVFDALPGRDAPTDAEEAPAWLAACELRLKLGAVVASEMRQAVKQETGFRCSAGVSCSKLLSKLVSGLHKPDDQTVILPTQAQAFVAPLPVRALPGVGYKADGLLKSWGVGTVSEACALSKQQLIQGLGEKPGVALYLACRGVDPSPVVASGPPKSITVEDSFKSCSSWHSVAQVLQVLVPDLLERLQEDIEEFPQLQRMPSTLTVKWRKAGTGWARSSATAPWPAAARLPAGSQPCSGTPQQQQQQQLYVVGQQEAAQLQGAAGNSPTGPAPGAINALTAAATSLLKQHLPAGGFSLTLLNIGATGFKSRSDTAGSIQHFLVQKQRTPQKAAQCTAAAAAPAYAVGGGLGPTGAGVGPAGPDLLQQAKAATAARRDYSRAGRSCSSTLPWSPQQSGPGPSSSSSPQQATDQSNVGGPMMLSKRQERRLWELAMQQQQQGQQMQQGQQQGQQQRQQQCAPGALLEQQQQQQQLNTLQPLVSKCCMPLPEEPPPQTPGPVTDHGLPDQPSAKRQRCLDSSSSAVVATAVDSPAAAAVDDARWSHLHHPKGVTLNLADRAAAAAATAGVQDCADTCADAAVGNAGCVEGSVAGDDASVAAAAAAGGTVLHCTNLHSVEGWGLVACEVIEDFDEDYEDDCD